MKTEPNIYKASEFIGTHQVTFEGEQYSGQPILDTRVSIQGITICWITWSEKESFVNELRSVFDKYSI